MNEWVSECVNEQVSGSVCVRVSDMEERRSSYVEKCNRVEKCV